jgi:hypothetical protein
VIGGVLTTGLPLGARAAKPPAAGPSAGAVDPLDPQAIAAVAACYQQVRSALETAGTQ